MKTILAFLLCFTGCLRAVDLAFEWDAAPAEFQVVSYNIYEITGPTDRVKLGNATEPTFTVQGVTPGFHRYEVTLVNLWGESVAYATGETPPVIPSPLQPVPLKFKTVNLQASEDMNKWYDIAAVPVSSKSRMFYRLTFN